MAISESQLAVLASELSGDPLARGYAGMTDQQRLDSLRLVDRDNWIDINSAQMFEAVDSPEFIALSAGDRSRIDRLLGLGDGIQTAPGSKSRAEFLNVFGGGSESAQNLAPIANPLQNRAQELGIPRLGFGDVATARNL